MEGDEMAEEKRIAIFGEALEGSGYPKMLAGVLGHDQAEEIGQYVMENLADMITGEPGKESVTIEFTHRKMTQKEIEELPDL